MDNFEIIQAYFDKLPKIKLDKLDEAHFKDVPLKTFIKDFIQKYNRTHNTVTARVGRIDTGTGRLRSLNDIYKLSKFYYPEVSFKEVFQAILELTLDLQMHGKWHCSTIYKYVFAPNEPDNDEVYLLRDDTLFTEDSMPAVPNEILDLNIYDLVEELGYKQSHFENPDYDNGDTDW